MIQVKSFVAAAETTAAALSTLLASIDGAVPITPDFLWVFFGSAHDDDAIWTCLRRKFPKAALIGGTSCSGVMSEAGLGGVDSIGLLLVEDPHGAYGSAACHLIDDPADCAERALHDALASADCAGELPELIWIYQSPGHEEAVLEGLRRVVGDRCPILGGSSADNAIAGRWRQLGPHGPMSDGLVVGVLFSSGGIGVDLQGGYEPSGESGIVTRVDRHAAAEVDATGKVRGRHIVSIDDQPAAIVYDRWIDGALADMLDHGGSALLRTTMCPLGIKTGKIEGIPHYLPLHPDRILPGGVLSTFAAVEEGATVFAMRGNKSRLVARAGKVVSAAANTLPNAISGVAGGLVVYCAGCMFAVGEDMHDVSSTIARSFDGAPFLGCFTFGEQGTVLGKNVHGNLMISAIVFGK